MKTFLKRLQGISLALLALSPAALAADSMTTAASITDARMVHSAALLPDGRVLVAGGGVTDTIADAGVIFSTQVFDPVMGAWSTVSSDSLRRKMATATVLPDGRVLFLGGVVFVGASPTGFGNGSGSIYNPVSNTWTSGGGLSGFRFSHATVSLLDGRVLAIGGSGGADPKSAETYNPSSDLWTLTGSMTSERFSGFTATLLADGRVLVEGGTVSGAASEVYNPATGTWSAGPTATSTRFRHTATLLPNGKVLIAGGGTASNGSSPSAVAQLYDPVSNTFTPTGSLAQARSGHSATLLPNGKVVVIGGLGTSSTLSSVEIYDPAAGTWSTSTASLATARKFHTATLLTDGRVVIVGGSSSANAALASVEIFTSSSPAWSATGAMGAARAYTQPVMLPDGKILVPGGFNGTELNSADLYNPATGTWSSAGTMVSAHTEATATLLPNGKVLLAGHRAPGDANKSELYDPVAGTWAALPNMPSSRSGHTATLLSSGKVLITGGGLPFGLAASLLFDPSTNTWSTSGSLATGRLGHTATALPNGKVLVTGGASQFPMDSFGSCELYDVAAGTWSTVNAMSETRQWHSATLLPNGRVLVVGGLYMVGGFTLTPRATAELFDPATGTWSSTGSLATARYDHRAELLPDGRVLVAGGVGTGPALSSTEIYNPATGTWSSGPALSAGRTGSHLSLLTTGKVLIAGGSNGSVYSNAAEVFDLGLGFNSAWQPQVSTASFNAGRVLSITGTALRGISGASGGGTQDSATDFPRVQLRSLGNAQMMWASPASSSPTGFTSTALGAFAPGHMLMTVFTNGIPSESKVLTLPSGPEIAVEQPVGTNIVDGGSQSFGSLTNGTSTPLTFTIKNSGDGALSLTGVSVTGGNASDFVVNSTGMSSSVAAGGSTTFMVTFTPSAVGSRSTTLQILSDDFDEATFDITLTGTGVNAAPTISDIANQTIDEDGNTGALAFTIGDFETAASSLIVTRSSSNTTLVPTANIVLGGTGASRTVTVTPAANLRGSAIITVTVSDGTTTTSDVFSLIVNGVNDAPTLDSIANPAAIAEDSGQRSVILNGISAGGDENQTLTVTATSDNTALIPTPSVTYTSPNTTGSVLYTPVANMSGTATITVTVNDGQAANNTFSRTFLVTVNAVNDAPTLDGITNPAAIAEDSGLQTINLTGITAGPFESQALVVTATSNNTALIPHPTVSYTSPNTTGSLGYTPVANANGSATITVTVNDQQASNNAVSRTFTVTVNPANDAPTISDIADRSVNEDASTGAISFTVGDVDTASTSLTVSGSSSDTTLVPNGNIVFGGSGGSRTVTVTPAANQSGSATITVTVSDGAFSASDTFRLTVNVVNDAPMLDGITNPAAIAEDSGLQTINLSGITPGPLESQTLLVTATSSNTALIPHPTVSYTSPNSAGSLSYTPISNANGSATITVTVNDQQASNNTFSRTFTVTVNAVNDAPTISDLVNQAVNEDTPTGALAFTIGDLETASTSLTVSGSSNNTTLVPNGNIAFGGSGANRTVTVTPAANQSGSATITVTVSDGLLTASDSFLLTVNSSNDVPTISSIANQVITYNTLSNTLDFTVGDTETAAASLTVTGSSSNQTLLPNASIFLSGSGANRGVTLVPSFNQTGVATVTLVVSDGTASTTTSFTLTVNAPEIVVEQPFASGMADGGTRGFGNVAVNSTSSLVFYIRNTNAATLTGLTITKDGTDASQFIITASPVSPVNGPGGNTAFTVQFAPTTAGAKTCALHIANNDPDENPFDITLTGNGTVPQANWRQTYFGSSSNSGNGGDLADPDGDGVPNLLEYAFGLHPGQNSAGQLPKPLRSGSDLVYSFTEPAGVTGIIYTAEWSQTLDGGSWTGEGIFYNSSNGQHTFTLPVGAAQGAFMRLRIISF
jgi:hypothetical protein